MIEESKPCNGTGYNTCRTHSLTLEGICEIGLAQSNLEFARKMLEVDVKDLVEKALKLETYLWNTNSEDICDRILRTLRLRAEQMAKPNVGEGKG